MPHSQGDLCTAPRMISLSPLSLASDVTDTTLGASGLWLGTQTGAGGTATLTKFFFFLAVAHGSIYNRPRADSVEDIDARRNELTSVETRPHDFRPEAESRPGASIVLYTLQSTRQSSNAHRKDPAFRADGRDQLPKPSERRVVRVSTQGLARFCNLPD